jgi:acyl-CoA synthetase (AMP-forming)/AMP-acid ligase II
MNQTFINSIHEHKNSIQELTTIYYDIEKQEQLIWDELDNHHITNYVSILEKTVAMSPHNIAIIEVATQQKYTYQMLEESSEKIANFIRHNIKESKIGLCYPNSFLFLATLIGINKTGRTAILFNNREPLTQLKTTAQTHHITTSFGISIPSLVNYDIPTILKKHIDVTQKNNCTTTLEDPAFIIFTSGTSGASKAALFSHKRMIGAGVAWSIRTAMTQEDNCYITLPLYHGNALAVAFSSVLFTGATAVLREKFSASHFFDDINQYQCSHMVYIGELWRYLINKTPSSTIPNKTLKVIFGNGLNHSLWSEVINRFNIQHVVEHFGATEMPAGALTNWTNNKGYCGFIPPTHKDSTRLQLINQNGDEVQNSHSGEALFIVPTPPYRGYLQSDLDKSKIFIHPKEKSIEWWRSGDLLRRDSDGFFTFVERLGDSYRFKGENISSVDVEEVLQKSGLFDEVVVYGIKLHHLDGKIGMASLTPKTALSVASLEFLTHYILKNLSPYARPYFLRIRDRSHQTTSTLKIQKKHLADIALKEALKEPHYLFINNTYHLIDNSWLQKIECGTIRYGNA